MYEVLLTGGVLHKQAAGVFMRSLVAAQQVYRWKQSFRRMNLNVSCGHR